FNLLDASEDNIKSLTNACSPATFGRGGEDVLDPSYRQALKLDKSNFATNFELKQYSNSNTGFNILNFVRNKLLDGDNEEKSITAELHKLNVYGKDAFFKEHKDTPQSTDMFASLVIAFPTPHCEGGELVLTHNDKSWTWDSASILKDVPKGSFAFIAFYSDVNHEVKPITAGDRLTLAYNLYLESNEPTERGDGDSNKEDISVDEKEFENALKAALDDPKFMESGGTLGFGLNFQYPINSGGLGSISKNLKGSDAMIKHVCERLGLDVHLRAVHQN
ncbi:hypothetical protein BDQ17DRAFT_1198191, partial [Cyathus striatus]